MICEVWCGFEGDEGDFEIGCGGEVVEIGVVGVGGGGLWWECVVVVGLEGVVIIGGMEGIGECVGVGVVIVFEECVGGDGVGVIYDDDGGGFFLIRLRRKVVVL